MQRPNPASNKPIKTSKPDRIVRRGDPTPNNDPRLDEHAMMFSRRKLLYLRPDDMTDGDDKQVPIEVTEPQMATLATSKSRLAGGRHYPTLDIDIDFDRVRLVESTNGRVHLYIDKAVNEDKYFAMLRAMADAGILGKGYVEKSIKRGCTRLRMPGIKKLATGRES